MRNKHPVQFSVFESVTCDGNVMLPYIFRHSHRLIMDADIKCVEKVVILESRWWVLEDLTSDPKDSVPCSTS